MNAIKTLELPREIATALTDNFWISESYDQTGFMLWYNHSIIGKIFPDTNKIEVGFSFLIQEVRDYLVSTKQNEIWTI